LKVYADR
jgi:hypothetical protein